MTAAAGAMALGGGTALADTPPTNPAPDHANSAICTQRIPAVLARIDKLTARINGDASVKGSTAWLRAKAERGQGGRLHRAGRPAHRAGGRAVRAASTS